MSLVYLNGEYKPLEQASINVLDRGFTFGDGVYEVIPVFNRHVFRQEAHLARLDNSLKSIYLTNPLPRDSWSAIFEKLIDSVEQDDQSIYLQISRGVSERDHDISLSDQATVFAMSRPIQRKNLSEGISAITHEDIRWQYCDIKAITLLPSVLLRHRAKDLGAKEAILLRGDKLTEGAASNVFICINGEISTPEKDNHVLPGITRDLLIEILQKNGMTCQEKKVNKAELFQADEIWVTSSTWEIVPVINLDGKSVGDGKPGPIWKKVNGLYQEFKKEFCR